MDTCCSHVDLEKATCRLFDISTDPVASSCQVGFCRSSARTGSADVVPPSFRQDGGRAGDACHEARGDPRLEQSWFGPSDGDGGHQPALTKTSSEGVGGFSVLMFFWGLCDAVGFCWSSP